jgi:hypothetical protein
VKRSFEREELDAYDIIGPVEQNSWRWGTDDDYVVPVDGLHFIVTIRRTEDGWCDDQWPVDGEEVELREVMVKKWVPK